MNHPLPAGLGHATRRRDAALVHGLIHARAGRRPYTVVLSQREEKDLSSLAAGAALAGYTLIRTADDRGLEVLIATRGPVTLTFENRSQVGAWLNHLVAGGALGRWEAPSHARA